MSSSDENTEQTETTTPWRDSDPAWMRHALALAARAEREDDEIPVGAVLIDAEGHVVGEGGPHSLGVPTHPGQAWSEGWATFFSSDVRGNSRYFDKQGGLFFWLDLAARGYSGGAMWQRPTPGGGLLQLMDENEVAAILWALAPSVGRSGMWAALADARATIGPFERGYFRRLWGPAGPVPYYVTPQSTTCLADYLDAVLCADPGRRTAIDLVTEPTTRYPYPSGSPLCR